MIAGLDSQTSGNIILNNKEITGPGPERAVVFKITRFFHGLLFIKILKWLLKSNATVKFTRVKTKG